jgi:transposase
MIGVLLREQFQLKLSLASVGRLLKQLGLTCQRPLFRAMEQDRFFRRFGALTLTTTEPV